MTTVWARILPTAVCLLIAATAHAQPAATPGEYAKKLYCLARVVYAEARGLSTQAQYDVAHSVVNRAVANRPYFGGSTICGVVYHVQSGVRQYSGITPEPWRPTDWDAWWRSLVAAHAVLAGKVRPEGEMRHALYYLNPARSAPHNVAWFRKNLRELGWSDSHLFYGDRK